MIVLAITAVILFECSVKKYMTGIITEEMKKTAQTCVNRAVEDYLSENGDIVKDIADIRFSSSGVEAISADAEKINRFKTGISTLSQQYIDEEARKAGVDIPLGELTGLVLLYDFGPSIHLSIGSKQVVACTLQSTFESGGINQTVHHIMLRVHTEMSVYNPYRLSEIVECDCDFEIAQTVIVGSVPSYSGIVTY